MQEENPIEDTEQALRPIVCAYCGTIISQHQAIQPGHCGARPCFIAHISNGVQAQEDQRATDYAERQETVAKAKETELSQVATHLGCDKEDLLIAVVPFQDAAIEPQSQETRDAFLQHLEAIVSEAFEVDLSAEKPATASKNSNAEPKIIDAACSTCQGFCCARGGGDNHAFLTVKVILGFRARNMDMSLEDVVAHYSDALPEASVKGACVFQSEQGCTLSRTSRAALCNSFYCHDLYAMHDLTKGRSDVRLAIVAINDDQPEKVSAFSEQLGVQTIPPNNS